MTDPAMPRDLDRILAAAHVPAMSDGLFDRVVAEATRADRVVLPPPAPRGTRGRWARRGVRTGIVAASLMLATAVAAAFGGGGPIFARIATVARHVVQHIRHPFTHVAPAAEPVHAPVVHRMTVPPAAIRTTPGGGLPMAVPHPLIGAVPMVARPAMSRPIGHAAPPMRIAHPPMMPRLVQHPAGREAARAVDHRPLRVTPHRTAAHDPLKTHPLAARHRDTAPRMPLDTPVTPRAEPIPEAAPLAAQPAARDGGLRAEEPRWQQNPRFGDGNGFRRPRQQRGGDMGMGLNPNPNRNPPGWRRRGGMGAGPRIKPARPGGGGRRRF